MRKIEHIEKQIQELTAGEFGELRDWILERDWESWDSQIQADPKSGKLDRVIAEARADYASGRTKEILSISRQFDFGRFMALFLPIFAPLLIRTTSC